MNQFAIFAVLITTLTMISFYINNNSINTHESFDLGEPSVNNNNPAIEPFKDIGAKIAADAKKIEDAKAANDKKAADLIAANNKAIADAKAAADKAAADKAAAAKAAADKAAADKAAAAKAAADKAAADKAAADKAAADKAAADKAAADKAAADKAAADKVVADKKAANDAIERTTKSVTVNDYCTNLPPAFIKITAMLYPDTSKTPKTNIYLILYDFYVNKAAPAIQKGLSTSSAEAPNVGKKFATLFNNGNPSPPIELYAFLDNADVINFFKLDFMKSTVNDLLTILQGSNNNSNASYKVPLDAMIKIFIYIQNKVVASESIDAINKSVTINDYYSNTFITFVRIVMSKYEDLRKAPKTDPYAVLSYYGGTFSSELQKFINTASTEEKDMIKKFTDAFNGGNPNPPVELYAFLDKAEIVGFINMDIIKTKITDFLSILNDLNDSSKSTYDADYKVPINAMIKIFTYAKGKIRNPTTTPVRTTTTTYAPVTTTYAPTTTPIQILASTVSVPGARVLPAASTVSVPAIAAPASVRSLVAAQSTVSVPEIAAPASAQSLAAAPSTYTGQSPAIDLSSYNLIKSQNAQLSNMITNSSNENTTDYQKSVYQNGDINLINTINNYLFIFYYLIVLVLVYFLYIDKEYSIYKKVFVLALFASYPYLANLIKYYVVKFFVYIYSFVNVIVYETEGW